MKTPEILIPILIATLLIAVGVFTFFSPLNGGPGYGYNREVAAIIFASLGGLALIPALILLRWFE